LPEVSKFDIDVLSPMEFYHVFLFLECNAVTEEQVRDLLKENYSEDDNGKFSVKEFIKEFKA
jgi:Ca2+-binding EF-hand superfamily protein